MAIQVMVRVIARDPDSLTLSEARRRISQDFVGHLDAEIRTLVARCLAPIPEHRPTLEELANTLCARLAALPLTQSADAHIAMKTLRQILVNRT